MNERFYFDGRQIKNYLVGFASLFSEIPYKDRYGKLKTVPIHYGSPSDVISYLEMNVDNAETTNRNRLKDISIPMFSFRMTGIERNVEKRRDPHSTITVDLRPLGYNVGYVAMRPAPYRFTMELVCWASSDYQAFEITEQIIPYFNSPQQVTIEPLPRCPVSTTEVFLDGVEIDTEPESQKYSAMVTMTFSLTGYLLTQPRIWSTNLQFELSMLDDPGAGLVDPFSTDYTVGNEIVDLNAQASPLLDLENKTSGLDGFILNSPALLAEFGENLDYYNALKAAGRIDENGVLVDSTPLVIEYKGVEKEINSSLMNVVLEDMEDIGFLLTNEQLAETMKKKSLEGDIKVLDMLFDDDTETIITYSKLLDNNLATKGFNPTDIQLSNSEKMSIFGTPRVDVSEILERMRMYLAGLENIKINKPILEAKGLYNVNYSVYTFDNNIPFDVLPAEIQTLTNENYLEDDREPLNYTSEYLDNSIVFKISDDIETVTLVRATSDGNIKIDELDVVESLVTMTDVTVGAKAEGFILTTPNHKFEVKGAIVTDLNASISYNDLDFRVFGLLEEYNVGRCSGNVVDALFDENIYKLFSQKNILDMKFSELDEYIVSILIMQQIKCGTVDVSNLLEIAENKYKLTLEDIIFKAAEVRHLLEISKTFVNLDAEMISSITPNQAVTGQQTFSPDLAQAIATDKNGKPIYDINGDGFINQTDLDLLGADVDNPEDYDYELKYGIWYKRFDIDKMESERVLKVMSDLKTLFYLTEKNSFDEIYDYLYLLNKDLLVDTYDLYPAEDTRRRQLIEAEGYNISELEDRLLFMRLFLEGLKNIMVKERAFILYKVPDMNEASKKMLYREEGLDIDMIVIGKYIQMYLNSLSIDEKLEKEILFRELLPHTLGTYYDYIYEFNLFIKDIQDAGVFVESLKAESVWLDDNLPEIKEKINQKYLN